MTLGAILVLTGSFVITVVFISQSIHFSRRSELWKWPSLAYLGILFVLAVIFIHGFSASIGMMFLYKIELFTTLYSVAGITLVGLFLYFSIVFSGSDEGKIWIIIGSTIGAILGFVGFLGFMRFVPLPAIFIFYSWVFILLFYLLFFIVSMILKKEKDKSENLKLLIPTILMVVLWIFRFNIPNGIPNGLAKAVIDFGFVPVLILPVSILMANKLYSFVVFIFYFVFLDFFFVQFDPNFNYLVTVGVDGCVGYDQETSFPVNNDPGIPLEELLKEPITEELEEIRREWSEKDFAPEDIQLVYAEQMSNGDSIKVISHQINGLKHYGAIRVPTGLDIRNAPILIELEGGGTGIDVSKLRTLTSGKCMSERGEFLSILPSYRGNILRGDNFCFRSEGYFGDAWLGPAEDVIHFLEAVKAVYNKPSNTRVIAHGVSRGATVALIIGGLTSKFDYVIANSTHTKFLDQHIFDKERVGGSMSRAFYTPKAPPSVIRNRIIASSPYYFAEWLPPFDLHQGTEDHLTTIWHARKLEDRLKEVGKDTGMYNFFIYEGKGHGYDEDAIVCNTLREFLEE